MLDGSSVTGASARAVFGRARPGAPDSGAADGFSLVVDLSAESLGPRWWRGVGTLALLCGTALALAPGLHSATDLEQTAPAPATASQFQINPMLRGDGQTDAAPKPVFHDPAQIKKPVIAEGQGDIRIQGPVTDGLYMSIRQAGVPSQLATDYLHVLSKRIDVGDDVMPYDRFDLVISKSSKQLVYAGLHRSEGADVGLMKWTVGGRTDWFDGSSDQQGRSEGLMTPVAGHITSPFGMRYHPILHFSRMHDGIDFGAAAGSPIVAAADGRVIRAGWAGGYGRQVRIAHGGGIVTTYNHMSRIAAAAGTLVRQGEVIGYVGTSGLSTGPHLHYEVLKNGVAVNPMGFRFQGRAVVDESQRNAIEARLKQLLAIHA